MGRSLHPLRLISFAPDIARVQPRSATVPFTTRRGMLVGRRRSFEARVPAVLVHELHPSTRAAIEPSFALAPPADSDESVEHLGSSIDIFELYTRNTTPGAMLGAPMVTFPLAIPAEGLPVGLTVQGARFDDRRALRLAERMAETVANTDDPTGWTRPALPGRDGVRAGGRGTVSSGCDLLTVRFHRRACRRPGTATSVSASVPCGIPLRRSAEPAEIERPA
ncbi:hypothetical protein H4281_02720 [Amycolatopsis sp. DR6-1]|uniref:Amidase domain-containing protein n=1 Tax=Amycolatopsis dendrobii TaxID=2760662 RepID=A0A7W3Z862_9PSEU|nr:hypothetical protein [Amycolatopsis dendrobii]